MISTENIKSIVSIQGCAPTQIITLKMPVNDASSIDIYDNCGNIYDKSLLKYSYSVDDICWSCYMSITDITNNTLDEISDFFLRIKVPGPVSKVMSSGCTEDYTGTEDCTGLEYSSVLDSEFSLEMSYNPSQYSPYAGIDGAIQLQTALSDMVVNTVGIPVYYFKANGVKDSADMTFKEYALKSISDVKQIKLVIADGTMPSSRPEFTDIGLDWQTDWETEISKNEFATAFGINAQPQEGDLVYIPMMKRMWMVNEAYDEKNGSLMWQSTTFKLMLTKYQADSSMDLGDTQDFVDSLVKNKYDDLFGQDNYSTDASGVASVTVTNTHSAGLYPIYKSDATRKYMIVKSVDLATVQLYHKGTLITENVYKFASLPSYISYQSKICTDSFSLSFIFRPEQANYNDTAFSIGNIKLNMSQGVNTTSNITTISCNLDNKLHLELENGHFYLIVLRSSRQLNTIDMSASRLTYPDGVPLYKLTEYHYMFDIDNRQEVVTSWNEEMSINEDTEVICYGVPGLLTNIKVFDVYDDKMTELLQQYPTNAHLRINDTARPLVGLLGVGEN